MSPEATTRRRVWITRAQPGAAATAARLEAAGYEPVVAPLLAASPLADVRIDLTAIGALAFTSAAGVRAYAALSQRRDLPAFAVGDSTADAARAAGFAEVHSAAGDATALADLIASTPRLTVLCPTAAEPAADLVQLLADRGIAARAVAVYETRQTPPRPAPPDIDVVLIHSAKAARTLVQRLSGVDLSNVTALAISPAAAAPLAGLGFVRVQTAPRPNEAALLALLEA